jgi:hypothetical protein
MKHRLKFISGGRGSTAQPHLTRKPHETVAHEPQEGQSGISIHRSSSGKQREMVS